MDWQLADAKNRFSELMTQALTTGPQRVRRRNQAVVVVAEDEYLRLVGERPTFKALLLNGPDLAGVDLERARQAGREVEL